MNEIQKYNLLNFFKKVKIKEEFINPLAEEFIIKLFSNNKLKNLLEIDENLSIIRIENENATKEKFFTKRNTYEIYEISIDILINKNTVNSCFEICLLFYSFNNYFECPEDISVKFLKELYDIFIECTKEI